MELYKIGSRGEVVRQIQKALHLYPDGIYGILTRDAVMAFQRTHGLTPDGIVGAKTLALLIPQRLKKSKRVINEIIIHCSATPEGKDYTVSDIRRWHTTPKSKGGRGWSDIGYHFVVYRNGHVEPGRDVDISGAHCEGHNSHSIGVCYVGGMDRQNKNPKDTRTLAQRAALISLLRDLRILYPKATIHGHREYANKACPSFDAKKEYKDI